MVFHFCGRKDSIKIKWLRVTDTETEKSLLTVNNFHNKNLVLYATHKEQFQWKKKKLHWGEYKVTPQRIVFLLGACQHRQHAERHSLEYAWAVLALMRAGNPCMPHLTKGNVPGQAFQQHSSSAKFTSWDEPSWREEQVKAKRNKKRKVGEAILDYAVGSCAYFLSLLHSWVQFIVCFHKLLQWEVRGDKALIPSVLATVCHGAQDQLLLWPHPLGGEQALFLSVQFSAG